MPHLPKNKQDMTDAEWDAYNDSLQEYEDDARLDALAEAEEWDEEDGEGEWE